MGAYMMLCVEILEGDTWVSVDHWKYDSFQEFWWFADGWGYYRHNEGNIWAYLGLMDLVDGYQPLDYARGLPSDVSPEVLRCAESWEESWNESWFLLEELLAVDWENPIGFRHPESDWSTPIGFLETIERLKELGDPDKVRIVFWLIP